MTLFPLPAFEDNYIWTLAWENLAWIVDPGDPGPVLQMLQEQKLELAGILVTHHHRDHQGGVKALQAATSAPVWHPGGPCENLGGSTVTDGDSVRIGPWTLQTIATPGHTLDHVCYWLNGTGQRVASPSVLFCGDTLFSAGCGRLFEGSPDQMWTSLCKLRALPDDCLVCCAHEYTLSNLRFARSVDPENAPLASHWAHCQKLRAATLPTLPSTLGLEKQINPFLRCDIAELKVPDANPIQRFAQLREQKNLFR